MKNKLGILLLICLNGFFIFFSITTAIFKYGIIVNGSFSIENSNEVLKEIFYWIFLYGILTLSLNYLITNFINKFSKSILISILITVISFFVVTPFVYLERNKFLENGRGNAVEIDVNLVQKIYLKNLDSGKITFLQKEEREIIWETERLLNYPNNSKGKKIYEVHIKFINGELIFKTNEIPKNK